jgi:hypothetical protein
LPSFPTRSALLCTIVLTGRRMFFGIDEDGKVGNVGACSRHYLRGS